MPQPSAWRALFASRERAREPEQPDRVDRSSLYFVEHTRGSLTSSNCAACQQRISRGEIRLGFRRTSAPESTQWIHAHCVVAARLAGGPSDVLFAPSVALFAREQILRALNQQRAHSRDPPIRWLYSPAVSQRWQPYRSASLGGFSNDRAAWDIFNRVIETTPGTFDVGSDHNIVLRANQAVQNVTRRAALQANRPSLMQRILDLIPPNSDFESKEVCSICHDEYHKGELTRCLPCGHVFHNACIVKWFRCGRLTCPMDRLSVADMLGIDADS